MDHYIDENSKVNIYNRHLEIEIVKQCNLNCRYCDHFSPWRDGIVPIKQIEDWFTQWSKRVFFPTIQLMGGEPLLHPDLFSILLCARKYWEKSDIILVTNGLLLPEMPKDFFYLVKDIQGKIIVSHHYNTAYYNRLITDIQLILSHYSIPYKIRESYKAWFKMYEISSEEKPIVNTKPIQDLPHDQKRCLSSKCSMLDESGISYCTNVCIGNDLIRQRIIKPIERFITYHPLTLDDTPERILEHLSAASIPQCCYCSMQPINIEK